jgi:thiamine-phosphate pyrophosphorylase
MPASQQPLPLPPGGLYLITPDEPDTARLEARVAQVIGHAAMLQYRNKRAGDALRREQASRLLALCRAHGVPLVVNDDWRLAAGIGADGAHLGADDGDLAEARRALPGRILGASCYDSLDRARAAHEAGADYLAFGALFPSPTKPGARRATPRLLREATGFGRKLVAIGGITPDNARAVAAAGADFVAVISAVFDAPDPAAAARSFHAALATAG